MTYTPAGPPQPAKKSNVGLIVGIIIGVVLLVCLACGGAAYYLGWWATKKAEDIVDSFPTGFPTPPAGEAGGPHTVRYEIDGTGKALITWARGVGGQDNEVAQLPWRKEITVNRDNFGVIVFAVPAADKEATITGCRIFIDGQAKDRNDATTNSVICKETFIGNP